jgi:Tfp pilus assembly protein PilF
VRTRKSPYLGAILVHDNDFAGAKPLIRKAIALRPDLYIAHFDMGIAYENEQQNDHAIAEYEEAARSDATRADAHYRLAKLFQKHGRKQDAEAEYAKVKQLHQKSAEDALQEVSGKRTALSSQ